MENEAAKIHNVIDLEESIDKINTFYKKWSDSYDTDLSDRYFAPTFIVDLLFEHLKKNNISSNSLSVIDAGCGTGLVGEKLKEKSFKYIDGFDLSSHMVEKAAQRNIYRELKHQVDLSTPLHNYPAQHYDIVLCCGVFTLGHVPASALNHLVYLCKPKGIILLSTRADYYQESEYPVISHRLLQQNTLALIHSVKDAPYTNEGKAHYWVYQVI